MKDFCQYGNRRDDEWEILPWIPDPRPPFKIWVKPEQIAPFFLIPHHPYAISLLLKISDGFRTEKFRRLGLTGSSADWERLVRGVIQEFEENNSGVDLFHFDSDEDVFCVYSQYIDDLMLLSKMIRAACDNEKTMGMYPELKMLTDAVASSKIISARKSEELVQKLCRLTSTHQAEQLRQLASLSSRVKPDNEQVYYIIDAIQTAILEKRQIQFQYYEYTPEKKRVLKHGGYLYQLDPYALEWKNDHYYLIGFSHKHQRMAHFRVDRLSGIKILPSGFTPDEDFDVAGYTNKIVDMFAADRTVSVELLCENKLMKTIIDHYGEAVPTRTYDEEHFTANIEVDPSGTFYGWVFKFMGGIQIIAPHECVEEMKRIAHRFL